MRENKSVEKWNVIIKKEGGAVVYEQIMKSGEILDVIFKSNLKKKRNILTDFLSGKSFEISMGKDNISFVQRRRKMAIDNENSERRMG